MGMNFARKAIVTGSVTALVGLMGAGLVAQADAATSVTVKPDFGQHYVVKPKAINPGTADGGIQLKNIKWTKWTGDYAKGTADVVRKTCVPNCAVGGTTTKREVIVLDTVSKGHFTKAVISGVERNLVR